MLAPATQDEISFPPAPILCPVIVHVKQPETCICPVGSQRISPPIFIPRVGPLALKTFQRSSPHPTFLVREQKFPSFPPLEILSGKVSTSGDSKFRRYRFAGKPLATVLVLHSLVNFHYRLASEPFARTRSSGERSSNSGRTTLWHEKPIGVSRLLIRASNEEPVVEKERSRQRSGNPFRWRKKRNERAKRAKADAAPGKLRKGKQRT